MSWKNGLKLAAKEKLALVRRFWCDSIQAGVLHDMRSGRIIAKLIYDCCWLDHAKRTHDA